MFCATECVSSSSIQQLLRFLVWPEFLKFLNIKQETVDSVLASDFNCGYIAALITVAVLLIVLLIIRLLLFLAFRTRRCSKITVALPDGEIVINRNAVEAAVRNELKQFPQLAVRKLLIFQRGKKYQMKLFCTFDGNGSGMPEISGELRSRIKEAMESLFGIRSLTDISICIERLNKDDAEAADTDDADTGL